MGESAAQTERHLELDAAGPDRGLAETLLGGAQAIGDGLLVDAERSAGGGGIVFRGEVGLESLAQTTGTLGVILDAAQLVGDEGPGLVFVFDREGLEDDVVVVDDLAFAAAGKTAGA